MSTSDRFNFTHDCSNENQPPSDIAIFLSLHTPVSTHFDSFILNVERATGPGHKIMLTFHRVQDKQEK